MVTFSAHNTNVYKMYNKLCNSTKFVMLFLTVVKDFVLFDRMLCKLSIKIMIRETKVGKLVINYS